MVLKKKRISSIALISFTDIIMLLLIFILVSSSFITYSGIKVNLPDASGSQSDYTNNIFISINHEGEVYLDQNQIDLDDLPGLLKEKLDKSQPGKIIVVQADKNLEFQKIVKVMDVAKLSGATKFCLATRGVELK